MAKERVLHVKESSITVILQNETDYISLTNMANGFIEGSGLIGKWMTSKNTLEYLGVWEKINNSDFNYPEFGVIGRDAGTNRFIQMLSLLNVALFGITAKDWRDINPDKSGNIRDYSTLEQLVVLSNMESINALLIQQGLSQQERLIQLNKVAINQMRSLFESKTMKKLK